jgi:hypothetical protein
LKPFDQVGVDRVERAALDEGRAHRVVDLAARQRRRVDPRRRDDRLAGELRRPAAFIGDADQ